MAKTLAQYLQGQTYPVTVVATTNITLTGIQTIDGIANVPAGDTVACINQTTASQNGIYTVAAGAWTPVLLFSAVLAGQPLFFSAISGATQANIPYIVNLNVAGTAGEVSSLIAAGGQITTRSFITADNWATYNTDIELITTANSVTSASIPPNQSTTVTVTYQTTTNYVIATVWDVAPDYNAIGSLGAGSPIRCVCTSHTATTATFDVYNDNQTTACTISVQSIARGTNP